MSKAHTLRNRLLAAALFATLVSLAPGRAHAASKEIIELQTQVQQLLDMVQRLQSTIDTRFGVIQHLVEQTSDNANRMSSAVDALQQKLAAQNEAISGKIDSSNGQVQSISDSVEELKSRLDKLQKSVGDLQAQLQNVQSQPAMQQQGAPSGTGSPAPPTGPGGAASNAGPGGAPAANQAPPLQDTFQAGVRDFNGARYSVAQGEFQDVLQYYPQDDLAGTAQFYLGEIAYRTQDFPDAVKAYNSVLESYSNSSKAPAAQLHKGFSLLQLNKKPAGIQELRSLIQRHPQTPEAAQARSKLNALGVRISGATTAHQ
jgi:tol-pal system protein YbgF